MMQSTEDRLGVDASDCVQGVALACLSPEKGALNSVVVILGMTRFFAPRQPDTIYVGTGRSPALTDGRSRLGKV
jgi:hypothetical protein